MRKTLLFAFLIVMLVSVSGIVVGREKKAVKPIGVDGGGKRSIRPKVFKKVDIDTLRRNVGHLRKTYTLERVEKEGIKVACEDVLGLAPTDTRRVTISPAYSEVPTLLQPDVSVELGVRHDSLAVGFAVAAGDGVLQLPALGELAMQRRRGDLPIVESRWSAGGLKVEQTAVCLLPHHEATK
jgi:hypothetical protein